VGDTFHIPGSVRGATLDAIASSMPELFSGIFFVVVAVAALGDASQADRVAAGAEGYGSTIATCAGSAVYNMILIPAFCALMISFFRPSRPTIDIEDEVIARDGLWFVACEIILIFFLFQETMYWWMALTFLGLYAIYILQLARDAIVYRQRLQLVCARLESVGMDARTSEVVGSFRNEGVKVTDSLVDKAREHLRGEDEEEEEAPDSAGALFGYWRIPISGLSATIILLISTCVSAAACYFLVAVTRETAVQLNVPVFFVAVILAAAASSVPDTLLAIGAAMRGDDSGAVSNAFGSNIFDICICLSIPLLVNSAITGWQPVSLLQDGKPIAGLVGLRLLLVALTVVTLAIIWHNRQLTRNKAWVLCGLYLIFIAYAVLGSLGILF
jgi:Ca2+/Na+ antiporter